jgi:hypothetical protein
MGRVDVIQGQVLSNMIIFQKKIWVYSRQDYFASQNAIFFRKKNIFVCLENNFVLPASLPMSHGSMTGGGE